MTDKLRELLEDAQTVYEGKRMVVHPNSFDKLRMEVIKLDNINKQKSEQIEKMKCCQNCKHYTSFNDACMVYGYFSYNCDLSEWEMKENG